MMDRAPTKPDQHISNAYEASIQSEAVAFSAGAYLGTAIALRTSTSLFFEVTDEGYG
jgi:hypothetical protein